MNMIWPMTGSFVTVSKMYYGRINHTLWELIDLATYQIACISWQARGKSEAHGVDIMKRGNPAIARGDDGTESAGNGVNYPNEGICHGK